MSEADSLDPKELLAFVQGAPLAVVFVSVHPAHQLNDVLTASFVEHEGETVAFARVEYVKLLLQGGEALPYLMQGLGDCGAPRWLSVPPGYWLFAGGRVVSWDLGLPSSAAARDVARGLLLGALWSGVSRNLQFITRALHAATEQSAGLRLATVFRRAIAEKGDGARSADGSQRAHTGSAPRPSSAEALARAYRTLGVSPLASDQEINEAWRKRRAEVHPDRAAHDPVEFERRSRLSVELNRARDVIHAHRAQSGARPFA